MSDRIEQVDTVEILSAGGGEFANRLIKVLGLEGKRVSHITIEIPAAGIIQVHITRLVHSGNMDLQEFQDSLFELLGEKND